jgi:hypothetical protein
MIGDLELEVPLGLSHVRVGIPLAAVQNPRSEGERSHSVVFCASELGRGRPFFLGHAKRAKYFRSVTYRFRSASMPGLRQAFSVGVTGMPISVTPEKNSDN